MYTAPWCKHCVNFWPVLDQLATDYCANNDLVISKFDCENEDTSVIGWEVKSYPTLIFYPKGNKQGFKFEDKRTLDNLKIWINGYYESVKIMNQRMNQVMTPISHWSEGY